MFLGGDAGSGGKISHRVNQLNRVNLQLAFWTGHQPVPAVSET